MPNLLVIDTATEACSVALLYKDAVYKQSKIAPREHGELILPMVDKVLSEADIKLSELDAIVYGQGPGAFTGLRICISVVQGLAFGSGVPVIGVSSLQAMAQAAHDQLDAEQVFSAIDARMGEVYWGQYQKDSSGIMQLVGQERVCEPHLVTVLGPDTSNVYSAVGTGWKTYASELSETVNLPTVIHKEPLYPYAEAMLPKAIELFDKGEVFPAEKAVPIYLRDNVAKKAKHQ